MGSSSNLRAVSFMLAANPLRQHSGESAISPSNSEEREGATVLSRYQGYGKLTEAC